MKEKLKLKDVYLYTYKAINSQLKSLVIKDDAYKQASDDLFNMLYSMQENELEIPASMLQTNDYAYEIAGALTLKKYPNLKRYILISAFTLLGALILFISVSYTMGHPSNLDAPKIEIKENVVVWEPLQYAKYYEVIIDDHIYPTTHTTYPLTPYTYGDNQVYVNAVYDTMFHRGYKTSNILTYSVPTTPLVADTYYYPNQTISLRTDALGYAKYQATFINQGLLYFNLDNIAAIDDFMMVVEGHNEIKTYKGMEVQSHVFHTDHRYTLVIKYRPNENIEFSIGPKSNVFNSPMTLEAHRYYNYDFNTFMKSDRYVTLKDYNPDIFINDIMHSLTPHKAGYGMFSWMNAAVEIYNNQSHQEEVTLIEKEVVRLEPNITHNLVEENQIQIYKVHIKNLTNQRIFYVEFDSEYYNIYFMDFNQKQLETHMFVSGHKTYITIPVLSLFLRDDIYIILEPRVVGKTNGSSVAFYNLKPDTGTYWPN